MRQHVKDDPMLHPHRKDRTIKIDLHSHSIHSKDSELSVGEILTIAQERGFHGVAITDHDSLDGYFEAKDLETDLFIIPGCEVTSSDGHILAYGVHEPPPAHLSLRKTVSEILDQDGIPVLAHPFRIANGVGKDAVLANPDILVEGINGRSWQKDNVKTLMLGKRSDRRFTGGSDAHTPVEVGRAWTVFPDNADSVNHVLDVLRSGNIVPDGHGLTSRELIHSKYKGILRRLRYHVIAEQ